MFYGIWTTLTGCYLYKELSSEHQKTVKKKGDIIEDLMRYKAEKSSEEKDLKFKQKKLNKKLKQVKVREIKLKTLNDNLNRKEVIETDDCNNNDDVQSLTRPSLTTISSLFTTTVSYNFPMDSKSFPSMVSHWLPLHMSELDSSNPECVNPTT